MGWEWKGVGMDGTAQMKKYLLHNLLALSDQIVALSRCMRSVPSERKGLHHNSSSIGLHGRISESLPFNYNRMGLQWQCHLRLQYMHSVNGQYQRNAMTITIKLILWLGS